MFIFNSDHHLIAADRLDLERWGFTDLYEAARAFAEGSYRLDVNETTLETPKGESIECEVQKLESLLGTLYVIRHRETPTREEEEPSAQTHQAPSAAGAEEALGLLESEEAEPAPEAEKEPPASLRETAKEEEEFILDLLQVEPSEAEEEPAPAKETKETEETLQLTEELTIAEEEETPEKEEAPSKEEEREKEDEEILQLTEELTISEEETPAKEAEEKEEDEEPFLLDLMEEEPPSSPASEAEKEEEVVELSVEEPPVLPVEELPEAETPKVAPPPSPDEPLMPLPETGERPWEAIARRFHPDLENGARQIDLGISEYRELVSEFVQDSRQLRSRLLSDHPQERQGAVAVLKDAIALLHLAPLDELLGELEKAAPHERLEIVAEYERLLDRLEHPEETAPLREEEREQKAPEPPVAEAPSATETPSPRETLPEEEPLPSLDTVELTPEPEAAVETKPEPAAQAEPTPQATPQPAKEESPAPAEAAEGAEVDVESFLRGVQPVPIEFSLHIAAQELSLPEDLVLEFINDFDKQGHEYLPVLIDAYQRKDLPHLQKTAHMLKGAASNLRIEAMVDNLYALQYDNDIERAPERIRLFAGQLMSLDKYLEQMGSQGS